MEHPPDWPRILSPAVCLFIYVCVCKHACAPEHHSPMPNGPLLGPYLWEPEHHIRVCGGSFIVVVCPACVVCYHRDVCFGMCSHAGGWPGPGRTGSTVPNLWSCSQSHLLAVLCVSLSHYFSLKQSFFSPSSSCSSFTESLLKRLHL